MKKTLRITMLCLLWVVGMSASAESYKYIELSGVWYYLYINEDSYTCSVTASQNGAYSGNIIIQPSVNYSGRDYSVTVIGDHAFSDCTGLTNVTIPNSITDIRGSAFYGCTGLTNVTIPNSVTTIYNSAFYSCTNLTSVTLGSSVTIIDNYAFAFCKSLSSINMPNSLTTIGEQAFFGCTSLPVEDNLRYAGTYLIEAIDKSLSTYKIKDDTRWIGKYAFRNSSLNSITIPNSVHYIDGSAFYNCPNLTSVEIPNSVTTIGYSAFYGCTNLTSVTLGSSVERISGSAFNYCERISTIFVSNPNPPYLTSIKDCFEDDVLTYAYVHVPMGSYEKYSSAYGWRYFNRFKEDLDVNGQSFYASLKVKQGENGYVQHYVKVDEAYTLGIGETANAKVNTILFNGEDVTDKLIDGYLTTPVIKSNSILSISYNITPSNIKEMANSNVKVSAYSNVLNISGLKDNDDFKVYSTSGALIESGRGDKSLPLEEGVYIIKVGEETFKVAL